MRMLVCALVLLAWIPGCSQGDTSMTPARPRPPVCDGTPNLRIFMGVVGGGSWQFPPPGRQVLYDNGTYLLVDGECRFWARGPDPWDDVRTGVLDGVLLAQLLEDVRHERWADLEGIYAPGGGYDTPDILFADTETFVVCVMGCSLGAVPEDVAAMRDALSPWRLRLWSYGTPVGGDVRVMAIRTPPPLYLEGLPTSTWPATTPIEDLAVEYTEASSLGYGAGHLLTGAGAEIMRSLRRSYVSGVHGGFWYRYLPILEADGTFYEVAVRDTTPYEDERGLIPMLHQPRP